jgi:hypothetical protein
LVLLGENDKWLESDSGKAGMKQPAKIRTKLKAGKYQIWAGANATNQIGDYDLTISPVKK